MLSSREFVYTLKLSLSQSLMYRPRRLYLPFLCELLPIFFPSRTLGLTSIYAYRAYRQQEFLTFATTMWNKQSPFVITTEGGAGGPQIIANITVAQECNKGNSILDSSRQPANEQLYSPYDRWRAHRMFPRLWCPESWLIYAKATPVGPVDQFSHAATVG